MVIKTFTTETPLNSAALAPLKPYVSISLFSASLAISVPPFSRLGISLTELFRTKVLLGGGQDAMSVTTTSLRQGKFETRFWHKIFEEEVGRVKGHFGPVNT